PVEVLESVQAPDPSTRQEHTGTEGEVEPPGGRSDQGSTGRPNLRLVSPKSEVPECQSAKAPRRPRHEVPSLASMVETRHQQLRNQVALVANGTEPGLFIYGPGGTGKSSIAKDELARHGGFTV